MSGKVFSFVYFRARPFWPVEGELNSSISWGEKYLERHFSRGMVLVFSVLSDRVEGNFVKDVNC